MITVQQGSNHYDLFDSIGLSVSLDHMVDPFSFATTLKNRMALKLNEKISILVNGIPRLTGFIEKAGPAVSNKKRVIAYSGRGVLCDLVDSSLPDEVSVNDKQITLEAFCQKAIDSLRIQAKVINNAGPIDPFTAKEIKAIGFGGKAGDFITSFARKRGVFLISNGYGNLEIFSPPQGVTNDKKLTDLSLTDRSSMLDNSKRFNIIRFASQDNSSSASSFDSNSVSRTQSAIDPDIRASRYLELNAEETMSNSELLKRANEEINIRRARGFSYSGTTTNHDYNKGDVIKVEDLLIGVSGIFLVRNVTYSQSGSGNTSDLVLCYPESYSAQGKRTSKKKSKIGIGKVEEKIEDQFDYLVLRPDYLDPIILDGK